MPNKKSIYLAILNEGTVRVELISVLLELIRQGKYDLIIRFPNDKPITFNRNNIVKAFLKSPCDYLMMIDDDIIPPTTILNLVDFQQDCIGALCFAYTQGMIVPIAWKRKADGKYWIANLGGREGLAEVDAVGTGCIILSRKLLSEKWFLENGGWFKNEYDKTGYKVEGNDIAFCRKAQDLGYKIYTHTDYPCSHMVSMDLKRIYANLSDQNSDQDQTTNNLNYKVV